MPRSKALIIIRRTLSVVNLSMCANLIYKRIVKPLAQFMRSAAIYKRLVSEEGILMARLIQCYRWKLYRVIFHLIFIFQLSTAIDKPLVIVSLNSNSPDFSTSPSYEYNSMSIIKNITLAIQFYSILCLNVLIVVLNYKFLFSQESLFVSCR